MLSSARIITRKPCSEPRRVDRADEPCIGVRHLARQYRHAFVDLIVVVRSQCQGKIIDAIVEMEREWNEQLQSVAATLGLDKRLWHTLARIGASQRNRFDRLRLKTTLQFLEWQHVLVDDARAAFAIAEIRQGLVDAVLACAQSLFPVNLEAIILVEYQVLFAVIKQSALRQQRLVVAPIMLHQLLFGDKRHVTRVQSILNAECHSPFLVHFLVAVGIVAYEQ
mmetsp:Transcript_40978/g.67365  ORF Transcript_40978/g.67365 Transcript_40978/m.67365 type:complete len:223 (-) Transcript_40978:494-1162(-)